MHVCVHACAPAQVFAAERSAVIAHLPSMDDKDVPAFFEASSAGLCDGFVTMTMQVCGLLGCHLHIFVWAQLPSSSMRIKQVAVTWLMAKFVIN